MPLVGSNHWILELELCVKPVVGNISEFHHSMGVQLVFNSHERKLG